MVWAELVAISRKREKRLSVSRGDTETCVTTRRYGVVKRRWWVGVGGWGRFNRRAKVQTTRKYVRARNSWEGGGRGWWWFEGGCSNHVHTQTRVAWPWAEDEIGPRGSLNSNLLSPRFSVFSPSYDDYHNTSYFLRRVQILLRGPVSPADWLSCELEFTWRMRVEMKFRLNLDFGEEDKKCYGN